MPDEANEAASALAVRAMMHVTPQTIGGAGDEHNAANAPQQL